MSKKQIVALIRNAKKYDFGGAERYPVFLGEALQKNDFDIILITRHHRLQKFAVERSIKITNGWWWSNQDWNGSKALLLTYTTASSNNLSTDILNYWLISGHVTDIPKINNKSIVKSGGSTIDYTSGRDSDRFLEDASFLRLKNISLSYNLPKAWVNKKYLQNLSIFVQGNNLLTFTKYTGQDPEVSAFGSSALMGGYDELTMPQSKSYSVGIHVGF